MSQIVSLLTDAQRESICEDLAKLQEDRLERLEFLVILLGFYRSNRFNSSMETITPKLCKVCSKEIPASRARKRHTLFCSDDCREKAYSRFLAPFPGVCSGTVGTINELRVATDLLKKKYSVFRALCPSCECDLLILKNGNLLRVEVTTGYIVREKIYQGKQLKDTARFDVLAVALPDVIAYFPDVINDEKNVRPSTDFSSEKLPPKGPLQYPIAKLLALDVAHEDAKRNAPAKPGRQDAILPKKEGK